jgi:hypothetical protein
MLQGFESQLSAKKAQTDSREHLHSFLMVFTANLVYV